MAIHSERVGDVVVLRPLERLDVTTAPVLNGVVERVFEREGQKVLIDLAGVDYVSSMGLAACLRAAQLAQGRKGLLVLAGMKDPVRHVFAVAGMDRVLAICPSRSEALATLAHQRPASAPATPERNGALTLPEEILLLAIQDTGGKFVDLPQHALDYALAGAVLMELCRRLRIDSDLETVVPIDPSPLGDDIVDPALAAIARAGRARGADSWIMALAKEGSEIQRRVVDRLVARGILERKDTVLHWVLGGRRYPLVQEQEQREVKDRVLSILRSDEVPSPRDVVIIALADACAVFDAILDMDEMLDLRDRISKVKKMDLLAQAMTRALGRRQSWEERPGVPEGIYAGGRRAVD